MERAESSQNLLHKDIRVSIKGRDAVLSLTSKGEVEGRFLSKSQALPPTPSYDVLWSELDGNALELSYLDRRNKGKSRLMHVNAHVEEADKAAAQEWCQALMAVAYTDVKPRRRLRILVNPRGGPGKAREVYAKVVEPIFRSARCICETTFTERSKHASDIAKALPLEDPYDALVLLSGDGLIHEVFNGFAEHEDPLKAFATPIVPVPTGSGNGTSLNLLGLEEGFDVGVAALNAIKGKPMKQDICSLTIGEKRIFTFMTQALGLMADLDLGTEHLRWMGDLRFVVGFLQGVIKMKPCPVSIAFKPAEIDKDKMLEDFYARHRTYELKHAHLQHPNPSSSANVVNGTPNETSQIQVGEAEHQYEIGEDSLPVLKHTQEEGNEDEGWVTLDKPLIYLYAGKSPYVGRDLMQFPVAHASDGLIDIVAKELTTRGDLLKSMDGADKGATFWNPTQHYFKAHAYRVTPRAARGLLSVDGESYPLQTFTVECHRALGTFLSPYGRYAVDFNVPRPGTSKQAKKAQRERREELTRVQLEIDEGGKKKGGWKGWFTSCFS